MGLIREPQGVDFVIAGRPLNPAEAAEVSVFLQKGREERAKAARERLEAEALMLPTSDRKRLAHRLIDSLTEVEQSPPPAKKPRTRSAARKQVRPLEKSRRRLVTSRDQ